LLHPSPQTNEFEKQGLQAFDALHLASAEGNADIFLVGYPYKCGKHDR
jgi:hypothetical protein